MVAKCANFPLSAWNSPLRQTLRKYRNLRKSRTGIVYAQLVSVANRERASQAIQKHREAPGSMKTLLRKISNGQFFKGPDQWTQDPMDALNFRMIDRALDFVNRWHLQDVEVVFAFADEEQITKVPRDKIALDFEK
jgi:hypothetical protein